MRFTYRYIINLNYDVSRAENARLEMNKVWGCREDTTNGAVTL